MEISCSLRNKRLTWILPDKVKDLCVRCASNSHSTKNCTTFANRSRKPIPKSIQLNYDRYKPVGYVKPKNQSTQNNRTNSHSRSRSRPRPSSSTTVNTRSSDSDTPSRSLSYVEMAASNSLYESI